MSEKLPASQMLRVPTLLVEAYQKLNQLHRQGHPVVEKLNQLLAELEAGIDSVDNSVLADIYKRLETLESAIAKLSSTQPLTAPVRSVYQVESDDVNMRYQGESSDITTGEQLIQPDSNEGLSQGDLCVRFHLSSSNISRHAKAKGMTSQEYLHHLTGWELRGRKWYPPLTTDN
ncbi:hypothetical protein [Coleofasciculus sp. FACHB-64]|uniref:hypothetical protein n=1 Tax=Cyanophyceae TaxID=3028117 RepID=UPI0016845FCF|nr:hypothetical protein [Coleofasciculus sp. FACHB-64]